MLAYTFFAWSGCFFIDFLVDQSSFYIVLQFGRYSQLLGIDTKAGHTYSTIQQSAREEPLYALPVHQGRSQSTILRHSPLSTTRMHCLYLEINPAGSGSARRFSRTRSSLTNPSCPYQGQATVEELAPPRVAC